MNKLVTLAPLLLLLGAVYFLRPPFLGGSVTYVMVSGHSMEPTMHTGDLALAWRQDRYGVGDVVAFRAEQGERSGMVIHRVIGGDSQQGYRMQGDNNDWVDPWEPTPAQVAGKAFFFVPRLGALFGYLQGDPLRLALAVGGLSIYFSLAGLLLAGSSGGGRRQRLLRMRKARRRGGLASWLSA